MFCSLLVQKKQQILSSTVLPHSHFPMEYMLTLFNKNIVLIQTHACSAKQQDVRPEASVQSYATRTHSAQECCSTDLFRVVL